MPSIITADNGAVSGSAGIKQSADSSGVLALATGTGTTAVTIDASQNVGIGTSSPATALEVKGSSPSINVNGTTFASFRGYSIRSNGTEIASMLAEASAGENRITAGFSGFGGFQTFYTNGVERARIDSSGSFILAGSTAQKATGTTWSNPSDFRLKDNIRDYVKGTAELMQVRVREWEYNGKGGTVAGTKGLGVVADEAMLVLPDTVSDYEAKLNADDEAVTDIKKFDATEITWLLVKTVQEQQALITQLQADVAALKATK